MGVAGTTTRKKRAPTHLVRTAGMFMGPAEGWKCSCGTDSTRTTSTAGEHLQRAVDGILRRMTDEEKNMLIWVSGWHTSWRDQLALDILRGKHRRRLASPHRLIGLVRPYTVPVLDNVGLLILNVDWNQVSAALDARAITAEPDQLAALRFAASISGSGMVQLFEVFRQADPDDLPGFLAVLRTVADIDEIGGR